MKLWSDYEGQTIAEAYPLKKLVRPEGRGAFFLTTNGTGTPALVRVIEAHFDESEILERWKTVSAIGQENLMTMRKFGETELDGTPLVYAVMEPTEISLEDLLYNRTLTVDEAHELAHSLIAALDALHTRGLVHGQVDPASVLAAGELVKLRSDCVKPAVDDPDGGPTAAEQKAADAHALAVVLLQALTGRTSLQGSATLLPSPFDGIIRNGLSGRWGLAEMASALGPAKPKQPAQPPAAPAKTATPTAAATSTAAPQPAKAGEVAQAKTATPAATAPTQENLFSAPAQPAAARKPEVFSPTAKPAPAPVSPAHSPKAVAQALGTAAVAERPVAQAPDVRHRFVKTVEEQPQRTRIWVAAVAAIVLLLAIGWRLMRSGPAADAAKPVSTPGAANAKSNAIAVPATVTAEAKPSAAKLAGKGAPPRQAAPSSAPVARATSPATVEGRTQWRVVAFTYNRQDQAQHKADTIAREHPSLNPEVFTPTGHAPYLVTVGGAMGREQAEAFKQKARGQGLPRDIYTQNYSR
ncbi:MAG: hypothetical protein JST61_06450 [Acidobacteria bacterium]|nr:hypothetical protein [Acidobacteriota bacterium]